MRTPLRAILSGALLLALAVPPAHATSIAVKADGRTEVKRKPYAKKRIVTRVNLNTATAAQIAALPYLDYQDARQIIAARPITDVQDLVANGILTQQQVDKVHLRVRTSGSGKNAGGDVRSASATRTSTWKNDKHGKGEHPDVDHSRSIVNRINVNTATRAELDALPGVDDATAYRIISARPILEGKDLVSRGVISQDQYDQIHLRITTKVGTD